MVDAQTFILVGTRSGPIRCQILGALEVEPHTVKELVKTVGGDPRTLREHLAVLKAYNIVDAHKRPGDTEYDLADEAPALPI